MENVQRVFLLAGRVIGYVDRNDLEKFGNGLNSGKKNKNLGHFSMDMKRLGHMFCFELFQPWIGNALENCMRILK